MRSDGAEHTRGTPGIVAVALPLPSEEQVRADTYALIARLLLAPPDDALLALLSDVGFDAGEIAPVAPDAPLQRAWSGLSLAARRLPGDAVRDEFSALFISTSVPKINPYGSLYLAGFLHEQPLAALRSDLAGLGMARRSGVLETEDHLGALCETMRHMIQGGQGAPRRSVARQRQFFDVHIASWSEACLEHLREADGAAFYACLADFIAAFFDLERAAFDVAGDGEAD